VNSAGGIVEYEDDGSIIFLLAQKIFYRMVPIPVRKSGRDYRQTRMVRKFNLSGT
jgi:hypothetical protein